MQTLDLTTEQMTYGGAALARHEGRVIFVPYALPGERVRVRVERSNKRWSKAELISVLEASPERVAPPCPHFGADKCGGCHWQHARYEAQLGYKTQIVREQFQRIGRIEEPPVRPCLGMAEPWRYRNHMQLRNSSDGLGFVRADKQGVYAVDSCRIMNQAISPLFEALKVKGPSYPKLKRLVLRGSERTGERLAIVEGGGAQATQAIAGALPSDCGVLKRNHKGRVRTQRGEPAYHEQLGGQRWRIHANSFFQVNTEQAEQLLATVKELVGALQGHEIVLDCYAGVGLLGLSLASWDNLDNNMGHLYLVESHPTAVRDAHRHLNGRTNVTIIEATAERVLPRWSEYGPPPDLVLLDPPRAGCKETVLRSLGHMKIPTIIYVSCDPTTQARDVRHLLNLGYTLEVVQPVDLFPQTYHIESVARLRFFIED